MKDILRFFVLLTAAICLRVLLVFRPDVIAQIGRMVEKVAVWP